MRISSSPHSPPPTSDIYPQANVSISKDCLPCQDKSAIVYGKSTNILKCTIDGVRKLFTSFFAFVRKNWEKVIWPFYKYFKSTNYAYIFEEITQNSIRCAKKMAKNPLDSLCDIAKGVLYDPETFRDFLLKHPGAWKCFIHTFKKNVARSFSLVSLRFISVIENMWELKKSRKSQTKEMVNQTLNTMIPKLGKGLADACPILYRKSHIPLLNKSDELAHFFRNTLPKLANQMIDDPEKCQGVALNFLYALLDLNPNEAKKSLSQYISLDEKDQEAIDQVFGGEGGSLALRQLQQFETFPGKHLSCTLLKSTLPHLSSQDFDQLITLIKEDNSPTFAEKFLRMLQKMSLQDPYGFKTIADHFEEGIEALKDAYLDGSTS